MKVSQLDSSIKNNRTAWTATLTLGRSTHLTNIFAVLKLIRGKKTGLLQSDFIVEFEIDRIVADCRSDIHPAHAESPTVASVFGGADVRRAASKIFP
jgi:hypothetical protein